MYVLEREMLDINLTGLTFALMPWPSLICQVQGAQVHGMPTIVCLTSLTRTISCQLKEGNYNNNGVRSCVSGKNSMQTITYVLQVRHISGVWQLFTADLTSKVQALHICAYVYHHRSVTWWPWAVKNWVEEEGEFQNFEMIVSAGEWSPKCNTNRRSGYTLFASHITRVHNETLLYIYTSKRTVALFEGTALHSNTATLVRICKLLTYLLCVTAIGYPVSGGTLSCAISGKSLTVRPYGCYVRPYAE